MVEIFFFVGKFILSASAKARANRVKSAKIPSVTHIFLSISLFIY